MPKILVSYFSASGTTREVAEKLANSINADIYEIKPLLPYTKADLKWTDKRSRSSLEMNDWNSRPGIVDDGLSVQDYDVIFVGFPIWWYIAPTIINTFLEKHDFSNKKIILFATSGGSGFGHTIDNIRPSLDDSTEVVVGKVLKRRQSEEEIKKWAESVL